jgi:hypothetical protein
MPRYYFDTHDDDRFVPDNEGVELDGVEEAKTEAVTALPDMASDALPCGDRRDFVITVRDEGGHQVMKATLSLVVNCPSPTLNVPRSAATRAVPHDTSGRRVCSCSCKAPVQLIVPGGGSRFRG